MEAADRANQGSPLQEEGSDEDDWTPKDAKDLAKKQKQMAKSGITFTSKVGPEAKVATHLVLGLPHGSVEGAVIQYHILRPHTVHLLPLKLPSNVNYF